jgi:1-phosphatidylinositol-4-phosphate 5-kinase
MAAPAPSPESGGGIAGMLPDNTPAGEVYYLGIIDILQQYDLWKMGETFVKTLAKPSNAKAISSVNPHFYAVRFVDFLSKHTQ